MKKLVFGLFAVVVFSSISYGQENPKVELKFLKLESLYKLNDLDKIESSDFEVVEAELISTKPFKFKSDRFTSIEVTNACSNESGFIYVLNDVNGNRVTATHGLWYGGGDCAIAGLWYSDDVTGVRFFVPGSAATQALNNVCGLSNVCKLKP
ncbi:hypothetical protein [Flavobacterium sp.]|uniref:hypothetical protein n=1 Tax=Flavobacterium sp. TaxID=239 RepID=UPI0025CE30AB|nr:hypothetical protein [Flavobacterium sp.]